MTLDEYIEYFSIGVKKSKELYMYYKDTDEEYALILKKDAEKSESVADLLRELKEHREFADWLVKAVLEEDWNESAGFYAEVLCRKLTKLGKLKVVDNKYVEVNADGK